MEYGIIILQTAWLVGLTMELKMQEKCQNLKKQNLLVSLRGDLQLALEWFAAECDLQVRGPGPQQEKIGVCISSSGQGAPPSAGVEVF